MKPREREDTVVMVRERVPEMLECHLRFSGWEDKEFSEDSSKNTEKPRKLLKICTINLFLLYSSFSYHHFYLASKGNQFKNKSVLIESIHKMKQEKIREKELKAQQDARRAKNAVKKEKRVNKKLEQMGLLKKDDKKDIVPKKDDAPAKDTTKKTADKKAKPEAKPQ
jgi:hypothetical protein